MTTSRSPRNRASETATSRAASPSGVDTYPTTTLIAPPDHDDAPDRSTVPETTPPGGPGRSTSGRCPRAGCGRHRPEVDRPGPPGGVVSGTVERSGASSWSGGAMSVVVGYVSTPEGDAALDVAVSEARLRGLR